MDGEWENPIELAGNIADLAERDIVKIYGEGENNQWVADKILIIRIPFD